MRPNSNSSSDDHIIKLWMVIIGSALLSVIFPPAGIITFLAIGYWVLTFFAGLVRIFFEHVAQPTRPKRPTRTNPKDAAVSAPLNGDWQAAWLAVCESPAEVAFLNAAVSQFGLTPRDRMLAGGGITLDLQRVISSMRVDFLVNERLVIEVDGAAFHSSPEQVRNDAQRDAKLASLGYRVLRIPAKRIFGNPQAAMQDIVEQLPRVVV